MEPGYEEDPSILLGDTVEEEEVAPKGSGRRQRIIEDEGDEEDVPMEDAPQIHDEDMDAIGEDEEEEDEDDVVEITDDGDEVLREIDVYVSQQLADSLYVFQYPTRPHAFNEEHHPVLARMKPKAQSFQLEIPLHTGGPHYNKDAGERLGHGLDDKPILTAYDMDQYGQRGNATLLDKQTLASSLLPANANYMIGILQDEQLHLTPVAATLQMRPSLHYIDKIKEKEKAASNKIAYEERREANADEEDEGKVLQVTVRSAEDKEGAKKAAQAELLRQMEEEPWVNMEIFDAKSGESREMLEKMFTMESDRVEYLSNRTSYLDDIHPKIIMSRGRDQKATVKPGISLSDMVALPLPDQVKALLVNAHIVQFSTIMELLGKGLQEENVVDGLTPVAVLVNGAWVVRSELLYSGRAMDARRYLLHLLQQGNKISRKEFNELARIPGPMATNMFHEIAIPDAEKGWVLKVKPDQNFLRSARAALDPRHKGKAPEPAAPKAAPKAAAGPSRAAPTQTPQKPTATEFPVEGTTMQDQLQNLVRRLFDVHGVCTAEFVVRTVLARAGDTELPGNMLANPAVTQDYIMVVIDKLCHTVNGAYVLQTTGVSAIDQFRPAIVELFRCKNVVRKQEVMKACKQKLGKEPAAGVYTKLMSTLAKANSGGAWTLRTSPV
ncbi:DNA-directed RNA polymerase III subunit RPC5 [Borealophlyctis nickersoniae]|nr:DNA-directed RNA polymerase III subunit RPC5 [Borealophlyctis nickersoniae]